MTKTTQASSKRLSYSRGSTFDEFRLKEEPKFGDDVLPFSIGVRKVDLIKGHWSHLYPQPDLKVGDTGPGPGDYHPNIEASAAFKRPLSATIWPDKKSPKKKPGKKSNQQAPIQIITVTKEEKEA